MKRIIIFCTVFLLLLTGCGKKYTSDSASIYHDYLDYSLGNWKITSKEKRESNSLMFEVYKYYEWTIEYTSSDNVKRKIQFNNRGSDEIKNRNFGLVVVDHAEIIVQSQIRDLILKKYFKEEEIGASLKSSKTNMSVYLALYNPALNNMEKVPFFDKLVSPSEGIKLYEVNAKTLLEKIPDYSIQISIYSDLTDEQDMQNIRNIRDSVSNDLMAYLGDADYREIVTRIHWRKELGTDKYEEVKCFAHGKEISNKIK